MRSPGEGPAERQAVAALVRAACVSVLRLPLARHDRQPVAPNGGLAVAPSFAVAYLISETLIAYVDTRIGAVPRRPSTESSRRHRPSPVQRQKLIRLDHATPCTPRHLGVTREER